MSEAPSASALIGQEIGGRYRVVSLLGEGGMGSVFLGEQKLGATLRKVAIKTLHPHLSHDPKILARFERECATVAELQHPNTIQVYDFGKTDDGTLYIVMEYVEGRSVAEILEKEGPMEPARVAKIMNQVCGSLEEAHSRGIIHRDLKPDNVVLCERAGQRDWVEVLDFGIAKRSSEHDPNEQKLTQQGMVLGTPPYMSPEQFTGKPIDARSDIYSLGVMAYEMLTGRLPFSGNTAWEWATQHMTARPVAIESLPVGTRVPSQMRAAINRALSKQPEERFQTVREFNEAFGSDGAAAMAAASASNPPVETRQKTEMAQPAQPMPGAYGPPPGPMGPPPQQMGAPMPGPAMAQPNYGPVSANQAFTSGASQEKKGPPKGLIIGAIAVLGIGSLVAILAGAGVFSGSSTPQGNVLQGVTPTPPPTTIPTAPETTPTPTPTPDPPPSAALPPLEKTPPTKTPPTKTPTPTKTPASATPPASTPPPAKTPPTTPPPAPDPPECAKARQFCNHPAAGADKAIQNLCVTNKQACFAKGGKL